MIKHKIILLSIILILSRRSVAQQYDHTWVLGSQMATLTFDTDSIIAGILPDTTLQTFLTVGDICDRQGNLLFYTNGVNVYNRQGQIMANGDTLSAPSEYYDQVIQGGMPSRQGVVILPAPGYDSLYYIFHYTPTDTFFNSGGGEALNFYYSIVDMRLDNGLGAVTTKNYPLIQDELLSFSRLAACKHANGRDWWIIKNAWHENIYYKFLLTPEGIQGPFIQQIGPLFKVANEQPGYSLFNPDGTKYVTFTGDSWIVLMDFDRCTGLFSNPDSFYNNSGVNPATDHVTGGCSAAISASGRFLYINNRLRLNQYDLWSNAIHDSINIETLNDTIDFYDMDILQLAPNGKIYISCYNGGLYNISVINQPDSLGLACDFHLYGQNVASLNPLAIPYFPNFRLGPLVGSGCDTLTSITDIRLENALLKVYPNPATEIVVVTFAENKNGDLNIYDALGREVYSDPSFASGATIDTRTFSTGMYSVKVTFADAQISGRFVKE